MVKDKYYYEPSEDSFLLLKNAKKVIKPKMCVLEVGVGSGFVSEGVLESITDIKLTACDINKYAVKRLKKKINVIHSDLFQKIKGSFDVILFNPPYLPEIESETGFVKYALSGGKHGHETTCRFIDALPRHLNKDGVALIITSSLQKQDKIKECADNNLLSYEIIDEINFDFEKLFCVKITKKKVLQDLEEKRITQIKKYARGNRGVVYTGLLNKKKVAIKIRNEKSLANNRIRHEGDMLDKVKIGPKIFFKNDDFVVMEFIEGEPIEDFIKKNKSKTTTVLKKCLDLCYNLDKKRINKFELNHPGKHIIVKYPKVTFIDFERAIYSTRPKNVTQFCQYMGSLLGKRDEEESIALTKEYKKTFGKTEYDKIKRFFFKRKSI